MAFSGAKNQSFFGIGQNKASKNKTERKEKEAIAVGGHPQDSYFRSVAVLLLDLFHKNPEDAGFNVFLEKIGVYYFEHNTHTFPKDTDSATRMRMVLKANTSNIANLVSELALVLRDMAIDKIYSYNSLPAMFQFDHAKDTNKDYKSGGVYVEKSSALNALAEIFNLTIQLITRKNEDDLPSTKVINPHRSVVLEIEECKKVYKPLVENVNIFSGVKFTKPSNPSVEVNLSLPMDDDIRENMELIRQELKEMSDAFESTKAKLLLAIERDEISLDNLIDLYKSTVTKGESDYLQGYRGFTLEHPDIDQGTEAFFEKLNLYLYDDESGPKELLQKTKDSSIITHEAQIKQSLAHALARNAAINPHNNLVEEALSHSNPMRAGL